MEAVGQKGAAQKAMKALLRTYPDWYDPNIVMAAQHMAERKIGALIVLERETGLKDYIESGHRIDAKLTKEMLTTIFLPSSPLHDGGVVIHKGRIQTAGCLLPLSKNPYINKRYGTRHLSALGLSEETHELSQNVQNH